MMKWKLELKLVLDLVVWIVADVGVLLWQQLEVVGVGFVYMDILTNIRETSEQTGQGVGRTNKHLL